MLAHRLCCFVLELRLGLPGGAGVWWGEDGKGLRHKHIAARLYISDTAVRHHLTAIFATLDISDHFELAIYAYQYGLAKPLA